MKTITENFLISILIIAFFAIYGSSLGCSDFMMANSGSNIISARTMDFAVDLKSELCLIPRGFVVTSIIKEGVKGISFTTKYGFIGINSLGKDTYSDGLNEEGLSFATLWLPGTEYADPKKNPGKEFISLIDVSSWLLGTCATVDEVKEAMKKVFVCGLFVENIKMIPPVHFVLHDANGKNLVVEYTNGKPQFYDNEFNVTTNYPNFDWQTINLSNYVDLTNKTPIDNVLKQTGGGAGMLGLPGDVTPPSRFVRLYFLNHYCAESTTLQESIANSIHILNNVDIVKGEIAEGGYTQWSVVRDHVNKVFYFKDYQNLTLRGVDLKELDFNQKEIKRISITSGSDWFYDVTKTL
ncbi:MAG: linear amide C-N hydrolase [Bacteroidales bacterium]|nr:linear amide C-N hydrolase [Bacteroidales bacterium]